VSRLTEAIAGANLAKNSVIEFKPAQGEPLETGFRPVAHSEKGDCMSEKRVDQFEPGRSSIGGKPSYEEPAAEWHDLRVITLGGSPGEGDSGAQNTEQPAGAGSNNSNGNWGSNHYDGNPDGEFGNNV